MLTTDVFREQPTLTGVRVQLELLTAAVLDDYVPALGDDELARTTGTRTTFSRGQVEEWLRTRADHHDRADWSVHRLSDGAFLGEAVLNDLDVAAASANYRIWLAGADHRGRGYGTEVTQLVVDHAFDHVGLHRLSLQVLDHNAPARRVYEKCGFRVEGRLREASIWDGHRCDVLVMGLLRNDPRPGPAL